MSKAACTSPTPSSGSIIEVDPFEIYFGGPDRPAGPSVEARMRKLGIDEYYPAAHDKFALLLQLATRWSVSLQHIAYIADDLCDLECMRRVGAAFCPADAVSEIMHQAHHVCGHAGGKGAVREVCDLILKARTAVLAEVSASHPAATGAMKL